MNLHASKQETLEELAQMNEEIKAFLQHDLNEMQLLDSYHLRKHFFRALQPKEIDSIDLLFKRKQYVTLVNHINNVTRTLLTRRLEYGSVSDWVKQLIRGLKRDYGRVRRQVGW